MSSSISVNLWVVLTEHFGKSIAEATSLDMPTFTTIKALYLFLSRLISFNRCGHIPSTSNRTLGLEWKCLVCHRDTKVYGFLIGHPEWSSAVNIPVMQIMV